MLGCQVRFHFILLNAGSIQAFEVDLPDVPSTSTVAVLIRVCALVQQSSFIQQLFRATEIYPK